MERYPLRSRGTHRLFISCLPLKFRIFTNVHLISGLCVDIISASAFSFPSCPFVISSLVPPNLPSYSDFIICCLIRLNFDPWLWDFQRASLKELLISPVGRRSRSKSATRPPVRLSPAYLLKAGAECLQRRVPLEGLNGFNPDGEASFQRWTQLAKKPWWQHVTLRSCFRRVVIRQRFISV